MTDTDFQMLTNLIQDIGVWILFAWLYIQEKREHNETRSQYRHDLREFRGLPTHSDEGDKSIAIGD